MNRSRINQARSWAWVLALLFPLLRGTAQFVEIAAEMEIVAYRSDDPSAEASAKPRTISVKCTTGPNSWRIEDDFLQGGENQWFFDGTNVYERIHSVGGGQPTINIWTSRDGHPLGSIGENIPWLAFCSGPYLKREGRVVPLPANMLRHTRDRYGYTDKTTTFEDELGLPRTVDLFTSRSLYRVSQADFDKEANFGSRYTEWWTKTAASLPEGVLTAQYAVTESTNFHGRTYPTRFEFFQKGRKYEQNGDRFWRGVGTVKSIRPAARPAGLLVEGKLQTVVDWRFRDPAAEVDAIIYESTNAFAAPTTDPVLQAEFEARRKEVLRHKSGGI